MITLRVKVKKLNKRLEIPVRLPDASNIIGVVEKDYTFLGEEVMPPLNPHPDRWYKDRNGHFYWSGGIEVMPLVLPPVAVNKITPAVKRKIERIVNVFETGTPDGKYHLIARHADYKDPETKNFIVQVTYGRSQTTEFGLLKSLIRDYVDRPGIYANELKPYISKIGIKPSLSDDLVFCSTLEKAGKHDPLMRICQDEFFDKRYYQRAYGWFKENGFTWPLSLLVIYDSYIHSGSIRNDLRQKFEEAVPSNGGIEKIWIRQYVDTRHQWLTDKGGLLKKTTYRTRCFKEQIASANWDLSLDVVANHIPVPLEVQAELKSDDTV